MTTTTKVRVYEVARELGMDNRELMNRFAALGIPVRNHMSALEPAEVDRVKRALEKDKAQNTVEERIRPTVVRRRTAAAAPEAAPPPAAPSARGEARGENGHGAGAAAAAPARPAPTPASAPAAAVFVQASARARPAPVAAAGAPGAQIIAFEAATATSDLSLYVGRSELPGEVVGASRALVNGLDVFRGRRGAAWQRPSGALSLIYWRAGVEVVTLCAGR